MIEGESSDADAVVEVREDSKEVDREDAVIAAAHEMGKKMAVLVDDTIREVEREAKAETQLVYINTDVNPPEVRRVHGPTFKATELWEKIRELPRDGGVTVVTIANQTCTVGVSNAEE